MALKLIEAPEIEPVTINQAIKHLNEYAPETVETEEPAADPEVPEESAAEETEPEYGLQEHIADLIATARETCEEYQNRAYLTQTWELWLDCWQDMIIIPRPPLQEIISVKYFDTENTEHTIDPLNYFADTNSHPGRLFPVGSWPSSGLRPINGICVTFTAGHKEAATVPMRVRQAILLLVAEWYLNREATSLTGKGGGEKYNREIPFGVTRLLDFDRVMPV